MKSPMCHFWHMSTLFQQVLTSGGCRQNYNLVSIASTHMFVVLYISLNVFSIIISKRREVYLTLYTSSKEVFMWFKYFITFNFLKHSRRETLDSIAVYGYPFSHHYRYLVVVFFKEFFCSSDYPTCFVCSDHGPIPRGWDMRGSTLYGFAE